MTMTENSAALAWDLNFSLGYQGSNGKSSDQSRVRPVSAYHGSVQVY